MDPFTIISGASLGLKAVGAAADWLGLNKEADARKKLARQQYGLDMATLDENERRTRLRNDQTIGAATARAGASGVEMGSGSLQTYLTAMTEEFRKQADWTRQMGELEAKSKRDATIAGANAGQVSSNFKLFGDLGASLYGFGAENKWFGLVGGGT